MPWKVHVARDVGYRQNQWTKWFECKPEQSNLFALECDDTVIGFAMSKPNDDPVLDVPGELHACYVLPEYRGTSIGPLGLMAIASFLKDKGLWPSCLWAFQSNPYRRIYPFLGCKPEIFRDRVIAGVGLPEVGYRVTDYNSLMSRLDRMRASAAQHQTGSLQKQRRLLGLRG
ncbi:GNAT family N-acetyltransferase [Roseibium porphyridii]|uniref:GNAT family N-acetyltransferase n=1 Tax=Roseibium porphyridii TaxID=2866279 RepID=UPI003AB0BB4F